MSIDGLLTGAAGVAAGGAPKRSIGLTGAGAGADGAAGAENGSYPVPVAAGAGWAADYGTAEDSPEMFEYLRKYSPVHALKPGVTYPATMVTTADHDDRVVPAHSFKFAAELQSKQVGANPTLIRIETDAGHGAGTPVSKTIEQYADIYGFTLYNMGFDVLPSKTKEKIKG